MPFGIAEEESGQTAAQVGRYLVQGGVVAAAGRVLHLEVVAVVVVEPLEGFDDEEVHRHPDRTAPVGIAPEQVATGFPGHVSDLEGLAIGLEPVGSLFMDLRQGTDAEIRQEFPGVEDPAKEAFHSVPPQEREEMSITTTGLVPARDERREVGPMLKEPQHALLKAWQPVEQLLLQGLYGKQRDQPHHGPHLERDGRLVRQLDLVVVELVLLIPESHRSLTHTIDGGRNAQEVLKELGGDVP